MGVGGVSGEMGVGGTRGWHRRCDVVVGGGQRASNTLNTSEEGWAQSRGGTSADSRWVLN